MNKLSDVSLLVLGDIANSLPGRLRPLSAQLTNGMLIFHPNDPARRADLTKIDKVIKHAIRDINASMDDAKSGAIHWEARELGLSLIVLHAGTPVARDALEKIPSLH